MAEENALKNAKFGGGLYLKDFPAKIRVLTRDPMVYTDSFAGTKYVFAVYNLDEDKVQILDKGPGFAKRFQEIDSDPDFGEDIRHIDVKIKTNGKSGMDIRYNIDPVGSPSDLTKEQVAKIMEEGFDLAEKVQKNNPNAMRLSEINGGAKLPPADEVKPSDTKPDVVVEDIPEGEVNLSEIPF